MPQSRNNPTLRRVWKALAIAYDTPRTDRNEKQRELALDGICNGLLRYNRLYPKRGLSLWGMDGEQGETSHAANGSPDRYKLTIGGYFAYPCTEEYDWARAIYCWYQYYDSGGRL